MRVLVIGGAWLWGLLASLEASDAGIGCFSELILFVGGLALAVAWVGVSVAMPEVFHGLQSKLCWLSVPAIGLGTAILLTTNVGLIVRVWLCESELRQHAELVRADPETHGSFHNRRVGLFQVYRADVEAGEVMMYTARSGFMDSAGIIYRPDGSPPQFHRRHEHLFGPWWWFWEKF